jgi:hypothetical protein
MPVFRGRTVNTPKPRNSILSPLASAFDRHLSLGLRDTGLGDNFVDQV